jgi:hypothetical protein
VVVVAMVTLVVELEVEAICIRAWSYVTLYTRSSRASSSSHRRTRIQLLRPRLPTGSWRSSWTILW